MKTILLKSINDKLKKFPDNLIEEVENYIDFLEYKHLQVSSEIPQWHKDEVLKRIAINEKPLDAFEMIDNLDDIVKECRKSKAKIAKNYNVD